MLEALKLPGGVPLHQGPFNSKPLYVAMAATASEGLMAMEAAHAFNERRRLAKEHHEPHEAMGTEDLGEDDDEEALGEQQAFHEDIPS